MATQPKKTTAPRKFHVVLTDGSQRTLTASRMITTENRALVLEDADGDAKALYADGQWKYGELESQDD